jgi:hypothetical protein
MAKNWAFSHTDKPDLFITWWKNMTKDRQFVRLVFQKNTKPDGTPCFGVCWNTDDRMGSHNTQYEAEQALNQVMYREYYSNVRTIKAENVPKPVPIKEVEDE